MIYKQGNLLSFVLVSIVERAQETFSVLVPAAGGGGTWVFFGRVCAARDSKLAPRSKKNFPQNWYLVLEMGQFFILRSRKFVNWNSPVFLKRYYFICSTYTSNKCFIIISDNFKQKIKPWSTIFLYPVLENSSEMDIPRSKSGASIWGNWYEPP